MKHLYVRYRKTTIEKTDDKADNTDFQEDLCFRAALGSWKDAKTCSIFKDAWHLLFSNLSHVFCTKVNSM